MCSLKKQAGSARSNLPECMQELIRDELISLCRKVEYEPLERRPGAAVFESLDKEKFVANAKARHRVPGTAG